MSTIDHLKITFKMKDVQTAIISVYIVTTLYVPGLLYCFDPVSVDGNTSDFFAGFCICTYVYSPEPKITKKIPAIPLKVYSFPQM